MLVAQFACPSAANHVGSEASSAPPACQARQVGRNVKLELVQFALILLCAVCKTNCQLALHHTGPNCRCAGSNVQQLEDLPSYHIEMWPLQLTCPPVLCGCQALKAQKEETRVFDLGTFVDTLHHRGEDSGRLANNLNAMLHPHCSLSQSSYCASSICREPFAGSHGASHYGHCATINLQSNFRSPLHARLELFHVAFYEIFSCCGLGLAFLQTASSGSKACYHAQHAVRTGADTWRRALGSPAL